ncbi:MAG: flavodoxin domain-containing protein [Angustibacter sp.]
MRALVTAASKHGSTADIAAAVADGLRRRGLETDVRPPEAVDDLTGYDVVVIGSAVYAGRWMKDAKAFVERHASALRWRDVWLFSSGPLGDPPQQVEEPVDVVALLGESGARGHAVFSGRLDPHDLGLGERLVARAVKAPLGDFRDWKDVDEWAGRIAQAVGTAGAPG